MSAAGDADRAAIASFAAHTKWSRVIDRTAATAPARRAFDARFEKLVDPDGILPPDLRAKLAGNARSAYFVGLARKSSAARSRGGA